MNHNNPLHLIAVYSCRGAQDDGCKLGPIAIRHAGIESSFNKHRKTLWHRIDSSLDQADALSYITDVCEQLANTTQQISSQNEQFIVFGGDHSCAIGTWSGIKRHNHDKDIGLIWIDAHMDSHLPETSPSKAIHGMPLACLLGHGEKNFTTLAGITPVVLPKHVCLIGVRSYEPEEQALLELLGVKVFHISDVKQQGFEKILQDCVNYLKQHTDAYGISIDLDAFDPLHAPGVGSPEKNGLEPDSVISGLRMLHKDPTLIGMEIVELNPIRDENQITAKLCVDLANAVFKDS